MGKKIIQGLAATRAVMYTAVVTVICADIIVSFAKKYEIKFPIKVEIKK